MSALFRSNSPSKRPNAKNRAKFPFILMPVTDVGDERSGRANECDPLPLNNNRPVDPTPLPNYRRQSPDVKRSRQNTFVPPELSSRLPPITPVEQYSPREQIRRTALALYPTTIPQDSCYVPNTPEENGFSVPISRHQLQAFVLPRISSQRSITKFRSYGNQSDPSVAPTPIGVPSKSISSAQLVFSGDSTTSPGQRELEHQLEEKEKEIHHLKEEQAKLKSTLKETSLEALTIKKQQESLRREFAILETHFETLEEKFETHDDLSTMRELVSQAARATLLLDRATPSVSARSLDFDRLIAMTHELNIIAGTYQALEIGYTTVGAKFQRPHGVTLTLYRNGMTLDNGNFRPYTSATTVQFIQDIYDGYFPTELQNKFPDGITITVKTLSEGTCYKLKTLASVTPDEIVRHLQPHLQLLCPNDDGVVKHYQLMNSVPFGVFSIGDSSLRHYGITANALLYFRSI